MVQNCKRCKAYFINSQEHASHEALRSCPSNPISKGEENLATRYRSLYKTLFPNSPIPASPFFDDCMSKEQYKVEMPLDPRSSSAIQPSKGTIQPSTIPSSTPIPPSSLCTSSAASSSQISQGASSSSTFQRQLSQRTEPTATGLTPPTTSNNPRNAQNVEQHDQAQVTILERQILKHLSTIQSAMLQHRNSSTAQTILVLQKLDAGLSELERLSMHTLRVSAEAPSPRANATLCPESAHSRGPTLSSATTIQAGDFSRIAKNVAPVSPPQPPTLAGEYGLLNENEGATSMNQQRQQILAIRSVESIDAEEGSRVNPATSSVFLSPRKRKRQRLEQNGDCLSTSPFLPFSCHMDMHPPPSQPRHFQDAVVGQWWDFATPGLNNFELPGGNDVQLPDWRTEDNVDDLDWQQFDLSTVTDLPLLRRDCGL